MFELVSFENLRHIDTRPSFLTTCCLVCTYCVAVAIITVALYGPPTALPDASFPFVRTCVNGGDGRVRLAGCFWCLGGGNCGSFSTEMLW